MQEVLSAIRQDSTTPVEQGTRFERLMQAALVAHEGRNGTNRFRQVWLWREYPRQKQTDSIDIGVDLVAEQTPEWGKGDCAIQCKFVTGTVSTQAVDSFLAASIRREFTHRILITTGRGVQSHGMTKLRHAEAEVFNLAEMAKWDVDWWGLAQTCQVIGPQVQKRPPGQASMLKSILQIFPRYLNAWKQRWKAAETPQPHKPRRGLTRTWLIIEIVLLTTIVAAVSAVIIYAIVRILVLLFILIAGAFAASRRKPKRRR